MKIAITKRWTSEVIFECEAVSLKVAIRLAIDAKISLRGADLSEADLSKADLSKADLRGANLRGADLSGAILSEANLSEANLRGADLSEADLSKADLSKANLRGADLRGADLSEADLSGADLSEADLSWADLSEAKQDLFDVLSKSRPEIQGLLDALNSGKIDGSKYEGDCCCLKGTIANIRQCNYAKLDGIIPDSSSPSERLFMAIKPGDTPENNPVSKIVVEWINEFLATA